MGLSWYPSTSPRAKFSSIPYSFSYKLATYWTPGKILDAPLTVIIAFRYIMLNDSPLGPQTFYLVNRTSLLWLQCIYSMWSELIRSSATLYLFWCLGFISILFQLNFNSLSIWYISLWHLNIGSIPRNSSITFHSLQIQGSNNVDVLLDSGLKLSDIIVTLCSKLLDYILLKSGIKY